MKALLISLSLLLSACGDESLYQYEQCPKVQTNETEFLALRAPGSAPAASVPSYSYCVKEGSPNVES